MLRQVLQPGSACGDPASAALLRRQRCRLLWQCRAHTTAEHASLQICAFASCAEEFLSGNSSSAALSASRVRDSLFLLLCTAESRFCSNQFWLLSEYLRGVSAAGVVLRETLSGMSCLSLEVKSLLRGKDARFPRQWQADSDLTRLNPLQSKQMVDGLRTPQRWFNLSRLLLVHPACAGINRAPLQLG